MAIRDIILHPDPRLKTPTKRVETIDDALLRLADDMLETMYATPPASGWPRRKLA